MMIFIKILVTILVVTLLSIVAERAGPRVAGILAGYPAGSAISLFFIGLEISPVFAGQSALFNVAGLTAMLFFLWVYYLVSERFAARDHPGQSLVVTSAVAIVTFLGAAAVLQALHLPPWLGVLVTFIAIPTFHLLFRRISNTKITQRVHLGPRVLLFRASISALVIVLVTGVAHLVSADWAGLFSAFPATVFPLVLIVHHTYGSRQAHTVIKNVPLGLWSLVFYSLTVSYAYPRFGIYLGTLLSFGIATLYLLALAAWQATRRRV